MPQTLQRRLPPSALRLLQSRLAMGAELGPYDPKAEGYTAAAVIHHSTAQRGVFSLGMAGAANADAEQPSETTIAGGGRGDVFSVSMAGAATLLFLATYYVMFDWIYRAYCLHWDGMYITDDDDDDDDEGGDDDDVTNDTD